MVRKSWYIKIILCYFVIFGLFVVFIQAGSNAVTVLVEHSPIKNRTCIAIDAGHGGIDGGAVSISGVPESQINLEIAERLNDLLHLLGYQTVMLRNTDTSLHTDGSTISAQKVSDLKHRVAMVSDSRASLLISIHQNTFSDKRYSGAQVFYRFDEKSISLARHLQNNLIRIANPESNRKAKAAKGIYLIEHLPCSGILIECGFLTNTKEEVQLRSEDYQIKLCGIIAATVSSNLCKTSISNPRWTFYNISKLLCKNQCRDRCYSHFTVCHFFQYLRTCTTVIDIYGPFAGIHVMLS